MFEYAIVVPEDRALYLSLFKYLNYKGYEPAVVGEEILYFSSEKDVFKKLVDEILTINTLSQTEISMINDKAEYGEFCLIDNKKIKEYKKSKVNNYEDFKDQYYTRQIIYDFNECLNLC